MAWRYADGMEAEARSRDAAAADGTCADAQPITLAADVDFALALAEGLTAAAAPATTSPTASGASSARSATPTAAPATSARRSPGAAS